MGESILEKHEKRITPFRYIKHKAMSIPKGQLRFSAIELFFWAAFAASAFTAAYLQELGHNAKTVGTIMACVNVVGLIASPVMGSLSDRMQSARRVFLICILGASVFFTIVPLIPGTSAVATVAMAAVLVSFAFFKNPTSSLLDSWIIRTIDRRRTFKYGSVRLMGSFGYATMCIIFGVIASRLGTQRYSFFFYAALNIPLLLLCVMGMQDEREDEKRRRGEVAGKREKKEKKKGQSPLLLALKGYYFRMFLISHALLGMTLYCMTTFLPYKLTEIAGNADSLGLVIALKSYMEIPTFLFGAMIMRKIDIRKLFPICATVFVTEQVICLFAGSVWQVALSLMMHGFTYGMYLTCMVNYVYRVTPREASASAMAICGSLQLGMSVIGSVLGGMLVDAFGSAGYYTFSVVIQTIALGAFLVTHPLARKLGYPEPDLEGVA